MNYPINIVLLVASLMLLGACKNDDESNDSLNLEKKEQLTNVYNNGIVPVHADLVEECVALEEAIIELSNTLSEETLDNAKSQWLKLALIWKKCELYDMGPISNAYTHFRIHRWPTDTVLIEEAIQTSETIDEAYVSKKGSSSIGLAAIEYLLFAESTEQTLASLQGNDSRTAYLRALAAYLHTTALDLQTQWDNYGTIFTDALQNGLDGGQNQLINALTAWLEETIKLRLENPLGLSNNNPISIDEAETFYSNSSIAMIQSGFEELEKCYLGAYNNDHPTGFDDYLITLDNARLNDQILNAMSICGEGFNALADREMNEWLVDNPDKLESLSNALHDLVILIKVDMASYLGVVITVTDADGD